MSRDEVLSRLRERIVAFATSRTSRDVAEDLAQEVLMVLHDRYADVDRLEDLIPLSLQIMRFKMAGLRRKMVRRGEAGQLPVEEVQPPDLGPSPETHAARREMLDRMLKGIEHLAERCRELFRLKLLGHSFTEIQKKMGAATINTVYTWDARCRKNLLDAMGGRWEAPE